MSDRVPAGDVSKVVPPGLVLATVAVRTVVAADEAGEPADKGRTVSVLPGTSGCEVTAAAAVVGAGEALPPAGTGVAAEVGAAGGGPDAVVGPVAAGGVPAAAAVGADGAAGDEAPAAGRMTVA